MMLSRRTFALTSLGLAAAATLAACSSKSKDEATEEGKMALIVPDAGEAAAAAMTDAGERVTQVRAAMEDFARILVDRAA